jgi:hypothetical protein
VSDANRGHQLYIYLDLHIYLLLQARSPISNGISVNRMHCCLQLFGSPSNGAKLHREGTGSTFNDRMDVDRGLMREQSFIQ